MLHSLSYDMILNLDMNIDRLLMIHVLRAVVSDPRFAHVHTDPRFQRLPKQQRTVKVDSRFSRMFTDPSFKSQCKRTRSPHATL